MTTTTPIPPALVLPNTTYNGFSMNTTNNNPMMRMMVNPVGGGGGIVVQNNKMNTSNTTTSVLSPSRTIVTSFTPRRPSLVVSAGVDGSACTEYDEGDWVISLACHTDNTIACAVSNGSIHVYDQQKLLPIVSQYYPYSNQQQQQATVTTMNRPLHEQQQQQPIVITDLIYGPEHTIVTTATNGVVCVTDMRTAAGGTSSNVGATTATTTPVIRGWVPEPATCIGLGYDGYLAAVGTTKGRIHFIDLRKAGTVLGSYIDSHTDTITQIKFGSSNNRSSLLSGSEDGLINYFDTTQPNEALAIQTVMNVTAPVRKISYASHDEQTIICTTGSETVSLWNVNTGLCISNFDNMNLRSNLFHQLQASTTTTCNNTSSISSIDYIIDSYYDTSCSEVQLAVGSNTGDAILFALHNKSSAGGISLLSWIPRHILQGGHKGIVRAYCPSPNNTNILYTAGEDARICEWYRYTTSSSSSTNNNGNGNGSTATTANIITRPDTSSIPFNNRNGGVVVAATGGGGPIRRPKHHQRRLQKQQTATPY